ncbi:rsmI [Symbiodinium sp. CCMP2592]|nr:rsmI [Symbiodinium sp. CCMP2592]
MQQDRHGWYKESWFYVSAALQLICVGKLLFVTLRRRRKIWEVARRCGCCIWKTDLGDMKPEVRRLIESRARQRRLAATKSFNTFLVFGYFIVCLIFQYTALTQNALFLSLELAWLSTVSLAFFGIGYMYPRLFSSGILNWWYVAGMALQCAGAVPIFGTVYPNYFFGALSTMTFRLPAVLVCTKPWLVLACKTFPLVMVIPRTLVYHSPENFRADGCPRRVGRFNMILSEVVFFFLVNLAAIVLDRHLQTQEKQRLLTSQAATELRAASSLLQLTCDAVVELDDKLRFAAPAPDLEAMLLKNTQAASLCGKRFTDLMPTSEEAERTENLLQGTGGSDISATAFHTRLIDSCFSKFRTEVFHVKYLRPNQQVCHLLGLRDFTDQGSLAGRKAMDSSADAGQGLLETGMHDMGTPEVDPQQTRPLDSSMDSSAGGVDDFEQKGPQSTFLYIDMDRLQATSASTSACTLAGKPLKDIFGPVELDFLQKAWVQVRADRKLAVNNKALNFQNLEVLLDDCDNSVPVLVTGKIEVVQHAEGRLDFLLHFLSPSLASTPSSLATSSQGLQSARASSIKMLVAL